MSFKYNKLRGRITEKYGNQGKFADALEKSENTVSRKLNGVVAFSHDDIVIWSGMLDIDNSEIGEYFFT